MSRFFLKKGGEKIKMESQKSENIGLEIPRNYYINREKIT